MERPPSEESGDEENEEEAEEEDAAGEGHLEVGFPVQCVIEVLPRLDGLQDTPHSRWELPRFALHGPQ